MTIETNNENAVTDLGNNLVLSGFRRLSGPFGNKA